MKTILTLTLATLVCGSGVCADRLTPRQNETTQSGTVQYIAFGNFDKWLVRKVTESGVLGGCLPERVVPGTGHSGPPRGYDIKQRRDVRGRYFRA